MILDIAIPAIEKVVNHVIQLDAEHEKKLASLNDKTLNVNVSDLAIHLYIRVAGKQLLFSQSEQLADASISGKLTDFITLLQADDAMNQMPNSHLVIEGNIHLVQAFRTLFANLDIDWEEQLSYYVGDIFARQIVRFFNDAADWQQQTRASLRSSLTDYLQEEAGYFPTRLELNEFYHAVDTLRDDVERIAAKIARLKK